jgi:hypothetical protein
VEAENFALHGEMAEEGVHLGCTHFGRVAFAMEEMKRRIH